MSNPISEFAKTIEGWIAYFWQHLHVHGYVPQAPTQTTVHLNPVTPTAAAPMQPLHVGYPGNVPEALPRASSASWPNFAAVGIPPGQHGQTTIEAQAAAAITPPPPPPKEPPDEEPPFHAIDPVHIHAEPNPPVMGPQPAGGEQATNTAPADEVVFNPNDPSHTPIHVEPQP